MYPKHIFLIRIQTLYISYCTFQKINKFPFFSFYRSKNRLFILKLRINNTKGDFYMTKLQKSYFICYNHFLNSSHAHLCIFALLLSLAVHFLPACFSIRNSRSPSLYISHLLYITAYLQLLYTYLSSPLFHKSLSLYY